MLREPIQNRLPHQSTVLPHASFTVTTGKEVHALSSSERPLFSGQECNSVCLSPGADTLFRRTRRERHFILMFEGNKCILVVLLFSLVSGGLSSATDRFVSTSGTDQDGCGTSSESPCASLFFALNGSTSDEEIILHLGVGIYRELRVPCRAALTVIGAYPTDPSRTILECSDSRGTFFDLHTVYFALTGVTLRGCANAIVGSSDMTEPTELNIANCVFFNHTSDSAIGGSAIYLFNPFAVVLFNSTFDECHAPLGLGGAIHFNTIGEVCRMAIFFIACIPPFFLRSPSFRRAHCRLPSTAARSRTAQPTGVPALPLMCRPTSS